MRSSVQVSPSVDVGHYAFKWFFPLDAGDDDATESQCTIRSVGLFPDVLDHVGPYQGIHIGSSFCT